MIQYILSTVLCGVLISMPTLADTIQEGSTTPAVLRNIDVSVTSECRAVWQSTYPGDRELMLACPNLIYEKLMAAIASKLSNSHVVWVGLLDASVEPFLKDRQVNAGEFAAAQGLTIQEGSVKINARFTVLAAEK